MKYKIKVLKTVEIDPETGHETPIKPITMYKTKIKVPDDYAGNHRDYIYNYLKINQETMFLLGDSIQSEPTFFTRLKQRRQLEEANKSRDTGKA